MLDGNWVSVFLRASEVGIDLRIITFACFPHLKALSTQEEHGVEMTLQFAQKSFAE